MPGPLPDPNRRRRNAPTIPTTKLPARGRKGAAPKCPIELASSGVAWWKWAWKTPQAAGWSKGDLYLVARRAQLEDDLAVIADVEGLDLVEAVDVEKFAELRQLVTRLAALVSGRLVICREMREIEDRLGLTPKGMASLRWSIVADADSPPAPASSPAGVSRLDDRRRRLTDAS